MNDEHIPTDKIIKLQVLYFKWGKNSNLKIYCLEPELEIKFFFSVFQNNQYSSSKNKFNFKDFKDNLFPEKNMIKAEFTRTRMGYLNCLYAELL